MDDFSEARLKQQVDNALVQIKQILDNTRNPQLAEQVAHSYMDKFHLANFVTNTGLAANLNCLLALGLNDAGLQKLLGWSKKRSVTIRLSASSRCKFNRHIKKDVEDPTKIVEKTSVGVFSSTKETKIVREVNEWYWDFDADWVLYCYPGTDHGDRVVITQGKGGCELMTGYDSNPQSSSSGERAGYECDLTWLLQHINEDHQAVFEVDRANPSCHTPRRNPDVEASLSWFGRFSSWAGSVAQYFTNALFPIHPNHGLDMKSLVATGIFVPVVPLFEEVIQAPGALEYKDGGDEEKKVVPAGEPKALPAADRNKFLKQQTRTLNAKYSDLAVVFPADGVGLPNQPATNVVVTMYHAQDITRHQHEATYYIEHMLRTQLIAAIGKEVQPSDFGEYMTFHYRKLFKEAYSPLGFNYAIRRPDHYPEGFLSIEAEDPTKPNEVAEPVRTVCRQSLAASPMTFNIHHAAKIQFKGERFLHAMIFHQFSGQQPLRLNLNARARQFSSFILLIGQVVSATEFQPTHGLIIQNKDDLKVPLLLEQIPAGSDNAGAVEGLSPEQQRFVAQFRQMQLAATLFGVAIIQIKPQLEKLLNLPHDSLTKEIRLTQDLMELFITYQIPSDLLSFGGKPEATQAEKLAAVKKQVTAMQEMIKISKAQELAGAQQEAAYRQAAADDGRNITYVNVQSIGPNRGGAPQFVSRRRIGGTGARGGLHGAATASGNRPGEAVPERDEGKGIDEKAGDIDYESIPVELDHAYANLDDDHSVRPTIVRIGDPFSQQYQKSLLSKPETKVLQVGEQRIEKNRAFDLLDALSRCGILTVDNDASLHVILAATHHFDKTLINTVIQQNVNPIEKVERTALIIASTIHDQPAEELVRPDQVDRVKLYSPKLFA